MRGFMRPLPALAVFAVVFVRAAAQAPPPPAACAAPENRQFDFWLGDWSVTGPDGKPQGTNLVTREYGGCVLIEHWKGAKGTTGTSLNVYDATTKRWHQTWADSTGGLLQLDGGLVDGKMVLEGPAKGPKGEPVVNRISWEKLPDGRVRQLWSVSSDAGKTWTIAFDGYYAKA